MTSEQNELEASGRRRQQNADRLSATQSNGWWWCIQTDGLSVRGPPSHNPKTVPMH